MTEIDPSTTIIKNPFRVRTALLKQHQNSWEEIKVWKADSINVPAGKILIMTALGGDRTRGIKYWMVDADRYENNYSSFYTIDENFDEERELV
jgi:hypothetical protein